MPFNPGGLVIGFRRGRPKPRPRPKPKPAPRPRPKPGPPGGTTPPPATTTTTTSTTGTSTTGLPGTAAGQLAQDADQFEAEQQAAGAYEAQQQMVTTPSTIAPASASQDQAADKSDQALQSFFSTGTGDAVHYHPGQTYAYEVAAGTGAENNPT